MVECCKAHVYLRNLECVPRPPWAFEGFLAALSGSEPHTCTVEDLLRGYYICSSLPARFLDQGLL